MLASVRRFLWHSRLRWKFEGNSLSYYQQLDEWQTWSVERIREIQQKRLSELLVFARRHVPYYRELLDQSQVIDSSGQVDFEAFAELPLLDKTTMRQEFGRLQSEDIASRRTQVNSSGGSTGEPVRFVQDATYQDWANGIRFLFDQWADYRIGESKVVLWGSERDLFAGHEPLNVRAGRLIRNETWLNAFRMNYERMHEYVEAINRHRPVQILAYVESIYELAQLIERENLDVHAPKGIVTSAGTLHPEMREVIERVFRAPVFNRYGSREMSNIAAECRTRQGLHVVPPVHYVEVLHPDGSPAKPGEVGEVVVTSLTNFAMPLVRYRIGDMAAWSDLQCTCGCSWPMLEKVTGRTTDVFVRRDGGVVLPEFLIHVVRVASVKTDWVRRFQLIQEAVDRVRVLIEPLEVITEGDARFQQVSDEIVEKLKLVIAEDCWVTCELVDDIPRSPSGKYRFAISKVTRAQTSHEMV